MPLFVMPLKQKKNKQSGLQNPYAKIWSREELEARDFLIVLPDARTAQSQASVFMKALDQEGLASHLVGVTSSRDVMFR